MFWTPKSDVLRSTLTVTESSRLPRMNIVLAYLDPGTGSIILQSLVSLTNQGVWPEGPPCVSLKAGFAFQSRCWTR